MLDYISAYLDALWLLTTEMAPYLLLGFLFAGLLKVLVPSNILTKYLGKSSARSVINATLFGIPLPLCSCGVLPAGISLYKNGASKGSSVSFLISTPQTGVDSILVTWSMLGLPMAILRPIVAFITGIAGGIFTNKFDNGSFKVESKEPPSSGSRFSIKEILRYAFIEMVDDIGKWLVIGLLIAAFLTVLIPDNFFAEMNITGLTGMLLILIISIPLYICATASVPIAAVLLLKGLSPGAILVFLMAGPATNAATMTVIGNNLGRRTLIIYMLSLIIGSIGFGLFIDTFLPASWFSISSTMEHLHGDMLPMWLGISSSILLLVLLIFSFGKKVSTYIKIRSNMRSNIKTGESMKLVLGVKGMSCSKCVAKVENGIMSEFNVSTVVADNESNRVTIEGDDLKPDLIVAKIRSLGYDYEGIIENDQT